jgi:hypothetical protein
MTDQATAAPPALEHVFTIHVDVAPPLLVGRTHQGERRIINIQGGRVEGPRLTGVVLPGGADWQIVHADGSAALEARYTLRAADGALVYVHNTGIRRGPAAVMARLAAGEAVDPASYYFRTAPRFETGSERHAWLTESLFVAAARREPARVVLDVFRLA